MKFFAAVFVSCLLIAARSTHAQSAPAADPSSSAKPADAPTNAPAASSPEKKKPKKVWTDDNIGSAKGSISVVGDGNSSTPQKSGEKQSTSAADQAHQNQIQNYREQIQQYRDQIDAIDKRINQLKNFKGDNTSPSGGINMNQGYSTTPVEDQIKQLEDKKKQLQSKIDDTEVEASKNGIDPGDLR